VTVICNECNKGYDIPITEQQRDEWLSSGMLIQKAFPQLSEDQRELFISGMCGKCFDALFEGTEDA